MAHAQAGVCSDVFLWGKLVSIRNGQTGGKNHHETGEVRQRSGRINVSVSREYSEMNTEMKKEKKTMRNMDVLYILRHNKNKELWLRCRNYHLDE